MLESVLAPHLLIPGVRGDSVGQALAVHVSHVDFDHLGRNKTKPVRLNKTTPTVIYLGPV